MCQANPDAVLELDTNGHLIAMTPTGGAVTASNHNSRLVIQMALAVQRGPSVLSSAGAALPLCPDLVVELARPSDEGPRGVTSPRRKVGLYQASGAQLGWLLLPEERVVEIWRGGQEGMAERLENASRLEGGEGFAEFVVELDESWAVCPLARASFAYSPPSIP